MLLLPKIIYVASQKFNITSPFMLSINELSINLVLCSLTIQQSLFSKNTQIRAETFLFFSLHLIRIYLVIFFFYLYIYISVCMYIYTDIYIYIYITILFIISLLNFLYPIHLIVYLSVYLFFLSFAFFFLVVVIAFFCFFLLVIKINTAIFIRSVITNVFILYCQVIVILYSI